MSGPSGNQLFFFSPSPSSRETSADSWENKTNCFPRELTLNASDTHSFNVTVLPVSYVWSNDDDTHQAVKLAVTAQTILTKLKAVYRRLLFNPSCKSIVRFYQV